MARKTYLIQCGKYGAIKIGSTSAKLEDRIKAIQANCPYKLRLIHIFSGVSLSEKRLHYTFEHLRIRGEWFQFTGSLKSFVNDPCSVEIKKRPKP